MAGQHSDIDHTGLTGAGLTDHTHAATGTGSNGGGASLAPTSLILPQGSSPAQTAEGSAVWDTDDDVLTVGTGAGRKTFGYLGSTTPGNTPGAASNGSGNEVARANHDHGISAGGGGAPDDAKYIVASANGSLSAEIPRPELDDYSISGASAIGFTSPTCDAGVAAAAETDMACKLTFTNIGSRVHAYVAEALGTGNFDVRVRIPAVQITVPHTAASTAFIALYVADSSNTASTRQSLQLQLTPAVTVADSLILGVTNASGLGQTFFRWRLPIILRIARSGTTISFYFSENEGRFWTLLGTATASTDFQRVGVLGQAGSAGTQTIAALVHWLRKF